MAEAESRKKGSAAELLGNWRAAERDLIAARDTKDVASLAANAAHAAVEAAQETSEAAKLGAEAANRAQRSAERTAEAVSMSMFYGVPLLVAAGLGVAVGTSLDQRGCTGEQAELNVRSCRRTIA